MVSATPPQLLVIESGITINFTLSKILKLSLFLFIFIVLAVKQKHFDSVV